MSTGMAIKRSCKKRNTSQSKQQKASEVVEKAGLCLCKKRKPMALEHLQFESAMSCQEKNRAP
jgi:hypothetical protein